MIHLKPFTNQTKADKDPAQRAEESPYESCICCHHRTDQMKSQAVWERNYYVEGAGQLCRDCYNRVYPTIR